MRLGTDGQLSEFIEGLGPGQLVGRQVLAAPALGDIQLSMCERKNKLEVEVIRARGLQCKTGARVLPGEYLQSPGSAFFYPSFTDFYTNVTSTSNSSSLSSSSSNVT